jgi:hypothetical protein
MSSMPDGEAYVNIVDSWLYSSIQHSIIDGVGVIIDTGTSKGLTPVECIPEAIFRVFKVICNDQLPRKVVYQTRLGEWGLLHHQDGEYIETRSVISGKTLQGCTIEDVLTIIDLGGVH